MSVSTTTITQLTNDVIELQSKMAYMEDTIEALNDVVVTQAQEIKNLNDTLKLMYALFEKGCRDNEIAPFDLLADKPPHY